MTVTRRFGAMILYATSAAQTVRVDLIVAEPGDCAVPLGTPLSFAFDLPEDPLVGEVFMRALRRWCKRDVVATIEIAQHGHEDPRYRARFAHEGAAITYTFCDASDPIPGRADLL